MQTEELDNCLGRQTSIVTSGTTQEVLRAAPDRIRISFHADGACFVRPGDGAATLTNGLPLTAAQTLVIVGRLASKRWSVISAATPLLGVVEYFLGTEVPEDESPQPSVNVGP